MQVNNCRAPSSTHRDLDLYQLTRRTILRLIGPIGPAGRSGTHPNVAAAQESLGLATTAARVTVLGIGSVLCRDDGVGIHVVRALAGRVPDGVDLVDGGTLGFSLLEEVCGRAGLIIVDAARLDLPPGTVRVYQDGDMDTFVRRPGPLSVHEVSVSELLDLARLRDELPGRRAIVAIQPEALDWGDQPAASVRAAIPEAADRVLGVLREWGR